MKSLIWKLYIYQFLGGFILIYPVYTILFKSSGLDNFQISILLIIWGVSHFILEVPTGAIADKYSRRNLLIAAELVKALGFFAWLIDQTFVGFAIGFVLWGISFALVSGTYDAFIYDELKNIGEETNYEKISGQLQAISSVSIGLALALGGFLAEYTNYNLTLIASIAISAISGLFLFSIKPAAMYKSVEDIGYLKFFKEAAKYIRDNFDVKKIVIITSIVFGIYGTADEMFGLVLDNLGISLGLIGIFYAIGPIIRAFSGLTAPHLFKNNKQPEDILMLAIGILWLLIGLFKIPILIVLYFIAAFAIAVITIKTNARLQNQIKSHHRATILSINSLICEFVFIIFTFGVGLISKYYNIISTIFIPGGIILVLLYLYYSILKPNNATI